MDFSSENGERVVDVYDPGSGSSLAEPNPIANLDQLSFSQSPKGIERMSWDDLCTSFDELDLNWNPNLRPVTTIRHWHWPKPEAGDSTSMISKGQTSPAFGLGPDATGALRYELTYDIPGGTEIWFLLSQHMNSKDKPLDDIALHVHEDTTLLHSQISADRVGGSVSSSATVTDCDAH